MCFGAQTRPDANMSDTALSLDILSLPFTGVNSCTGIPIARISYINGAPEAFFSIMTESGAHSW
jgi:hypothetical protein